MDNHKTFVLNTEDTFNKLQEASEKKAETLFRYRKLEKSEKIILAKLKNELRLNHDKISQTELTDEAYRQTKYKEWLIAYTQAEKDFTLSKDYYNNLNNRLQKMYPELISSNNVTQPKTRAKSSNIVTPSTGGSSYKGNRVRMTQDQLRMARELGINDEAGLKKYAQEIQKSQRS